MPRYRRSRYARKKRKPRKARRKRVYKVSTSKLLDKKINTIYERRAREIAQKEIARNIVHLIDRRFHFGNVNREFNQFANGTPVFYDGVVVPLANIDKTDVNFVVNAPDVNGMHDDLTNPEVDNDGAQQGIFTQSMHGRRSTETVLIDGLKCSLKIFLERSDSFVGQDLSTVILRWAVVARYTSNAMADQGGTVVPEPEELLRMQTWGYSSKLDTQEQQEQTNLWIKDRTLLKGRTSFQISDIRAQEKTSSRYVKFKRPMKLTFMPEDQNGFQSKTCKLWFVCRTNVPHSGPGQPIDYTPFAPRIHLCSKVYYHE